MKLFRFIKHYWGLIIFFVLVEWLFFGGCSFLFSTGGDFLACVFLTFAIIFLIAGVALMKNIWKNLDKIIKGSEDLKKHWAENDEKRRQDEIKRDETMRKLDAGEWTISPKSFYKLIVGEALNPLDTEYKLKKAHLIAAEMLSDANVPTEFRSKYLKNDKILELYATGLAEYERGKREPQECIYGTKEQNLIKDAADTVGKYGKAKRLLMFQKEIAKLDTGIHNLDVQITYKKMQEEKEREELKRLGVSMIQASQQKTHNWGLAGGIAEGLAGPGAGIVVAASVMQENAEIELRNKASRAYYTDLTAKLLDGHSRTNNFSVEALEEQKSVLTKIRDKYKKEVEELSEKIILESISTEELMEYIKLRTLRINDRLKIEISIKNTYVPDVPENTKMVVDGVLAAEVYSGKIHVGTAYAPLPMFGIPCGESAKVVAYCPFYLEGEPKYTVKYKYLSLWVMEQ